MRPAAVGLGGIKYIGSLKFPYTCICVTIPSPNSVFGCIKMNYHFSRVYPFVRFWARHGDGRGVSSSSAQLMCIIVHAAAGATTGRAAAVPSANARAGLWRKGVIPPLRAADASNGSAGSGGRYAGRGPRAVGPYARPSGRHPPRPTRRSPLVVVSVSRSRATCPSRSSR